jgi:hypothetical protein
MSKDLMLVGSIPYETTEQVFETFGAGLGQHLAAVPDGEVGPRRHWISKVHYQVMAGHPEFEILRRPEYENGAERLNPRGPGDSWLFRSKRASSGYVSAIRAGGLAMPGTRSTPILFFGPSARKASSQPISVSRYLSRR